MAQPGSHLKSVRSRVAVGPLVAAFGLAVMSAAGTAGTAVGQRCEISIMYIAQ